MAPSANSTHRKTRRRAIVIGCLVFVLFLTVLAYRSGAVVCTPSGTTTPILQLCKPASAETGWAAAINNNWQILDNLFNSNGTLKTQYGGTGQTSFNSLPNLSVFTSNGTFTVPAGVTKLYVQVYGAGGGGGGGGGGSQPGDSGSGATAQHGGNGGYGAAVLDVVPGTAKAITVGAGGANGSGGGGNATGSAGNSGGTSSFGTLISATGGAGGGAGSGASALTTAMAGAHGTSAATINITGGGAPGGAGGTGGGGGSNQPGNNGVAGSNGRVVVWY
jgi:hypothetical protein